MFGLSCGYVGYIRLWRQEMGRQEEWKERTMSRLALLFFQCIHGEGGREIRWSHEVRGGHTQGETEPYNFG